MTSLRERDGALINHWYIACLSRELGDKPLKRVVYERPYVIFRAEGGKPAALPDRCLHRATQLSEGTCKDGRLSCPYHGWTYDGGGNVVGIPSEGGGPPRAKLCLKPQPCIEQDGAVWVWMGEGEPTGLAPPWRFPEYGTRGWCNYFMITDFENEVTHLVENFMDVPHTIFVHKGWFRNQANRKVPMTLEVGGGSVLVTYQQPSDSIGFTGMVLNPRREPMVHTDQFVFPNITRVDYRFGASSGFIINSQCTPVGPLKSRVYTYIAYRIGRISPLFIPFMRFYTRQVIEQDVVIMRNQGESFRRDPSHQFKSTDADEIHIAIERLRELGMKGDGGVNEFTKRKEKEFWI